MRRATEPTNYSDYDRTYNNAIDMVAQYVGYYRKRGSPLKALLLRPMYYDLFKQGFELLSGKPLEGVEQLVFEGVKINKGCGDDFKGTMDNIKPIFWTYKEKNGHEVSPG